MSPTEIIYGINPVIELLRAGRRRCHEILIAEGKKGPELFRLREEAEEKGVRIKSVSKEEINLISGTDKNQGIAARSDGYPYVELGDIVDAALKDERRGFVLILDGVTDPQNLGSLVRTSHLMGVHGVVIPKDNAAPVTSVVVKSSAGATEHQRIARVTNIVNTISILKDKGFWIFGADGTSPNSLYLTDFKGQNAVLVIGAEGRGLRRLVMERCDHLLSIPMEGVIDSYNVSVAGAIFMAEVARSRWSSGFRKIRTQNL